MQSTRKNVETTTAKHRGPGAVDNKRNSHSVRCKTAGVHGLVYWRDLCSLLYSKRTCIWCKKWSRNKSPLRHSKALPPLSSTGLQNEVWKVNGSGRSVGERWDTCWKTLNHEPLVRMFKDKTSKNFKSCYDKIVDDQSKSDGKALRDSGAGTAESGSEDDVEKNTKVQLDKVLTAIVDAKAAARQDLEETEHKKADEAASHPRWGCGPSTRATPDAGRARRRHHSKKLLLPTTSRWVPAPVQRPVAVRRASPASSIGGARPASEALAGGAASGRSSPTMSTGGLDDDLSPAGSEPSRKVPPLGELVKHMGSLSIPTLVQSAGVTTEEADYFLNTGFTADEVQPERAVAMMTVLLDKRLSLQRDGDSVQDYMDDLGEEDMQLPGFDRLTSRSCCSSSTAWK
ncbi:unnamed protein product [Ectocarpus sp. CCAP 1310/34]|nr:unnamed protein product [Ectocarpus sp. CCAP 1310/34]